MEKYSSTKAVYVIGHMMGRGGGLTCLCNASGEARVFNNITEAQTELELLISRLPQSIREANRQIWYVYLLAAVV